jgi:hypothetical protein
MSNKTHGLSKSPEYLCWQQIKARCLNPNHMVYPDYGGRGITICAEWEHDFSAFLAHVGVRPSAKHSLDRIDNSKGYQPFNTRWISQREQTHNRRPHRKHGVRERRAVRTDGKPTNFKHGGIGTSEYLAWGSMKSRCLKENHPAYKHYVGRGITIHPAWLDDFQAFYEHVGPKPSPRHSLDRIDNSLGYFPGNVKWSTWKEQANNRRLPPNGSACANYVHGKSQSPTYKTWGSIKTRCFNPRHERYADYGGDGITMCGGWKDDPEAFLLDLGPKPKDKTLMRLDNDASYSCGKCPECLAKGWPLNCKWATRTEINRARRPSARSGKLTMDKANQIRQLVASGRKKPAVAKEFGIGTSLVVKICKGLNWLA